MLFGSFLTILWPFGHPKNDPKRSRKVGKWTGQAQYVSFKKSPMPNHLAHFIRSNGPNQPKKGHLKILKNERLSNTVIKNKEKISKSGSWNGSACVFKFPFHTNVCMLKLSFIKNSRNLR
jgi:hypothetical protein